MHENAAVAGNAQIYETASVGGDCLVAENAEIFENASIYGVATVFGNAKVYGEAHVFGYAQIYGNAKIHGDSGISVHSVAKGDSEIGGGIEARCISKEYDAEDMPDYIKEHKAKRNYTDAVISIEANCYCPVCGYMQDVFENVRELLDDDLRVDNCDIEITCKDCGNIFEIKNVTFEIAGINYKN